GGESGEIVHRDRLGDEEQGDLGPQSERASQSGEGTVRPVRRERRSAEVGEAAREERGVLLLLAHEEPERSEVGGVAGGLRLREQPLAVAALAELEAREGVDEGRALCRAHGGLGVPVDGRLDLLVTGGVRLEVREPPRELSEPLPAGGAAV